MRALHIVAPAAIAMATWLQAAIAPGLHGTGGPQPEVSSFDLTQRTCAMYVAVRSRAFDASIAFGRDLQTIDLHWNVCPGGTMVACATAPAPNGGTVVTGIPWPYGKQVN